MVVLALASEEPMHPYRMQTLIKQRGKDQIANVAQRNSVYQTIDALLRAGLIRVRETSREERRPERTIYEATEKGRQTLHSWQRTLLSSPSREFPDFPAALALLDPQMRPEELGALLETRMTALEVRLAELETPYPHVPRIFLIEGEYVAAMVRAEIKWLRGIVADLRSGRLSYPTREELDRLRAAVDTEAAGGSEPEPAEAPTKRRAKRTSSVAPRGRPKLARGR
jgi:DNA-binding PadR family transcriptional regulator